MLNKRHLLHADQKKKSDWLFHKLYFRRLKCAKQVGIARDRKRKIKNLISQKLIPLKYKKGTTPWERGCIIAMKNLTNYSLKL